jgi:hypothetical protein
MEELINKFDKIINHDNKKERFNNIRNMFEKKEIKKDNDIIDEYKIKLKRDEMIIILNSLNYHNDQIKPKVKEITKVEPEIIKEEKAFCDKMEFWKSRDKDNKDNKDNKIKEEETNKELISEESIKKKKKKKDKKDKGEEDGEGKKKKKKKKIKESDE